MTLRLGDTAPDFTAASTAGEIRFHDWIGDGWAILFSHPRDFTPVCTTELGAVARLKPEFDRRGVKVIGLSVDGVSDHEGWSRDIEATQGVALNFPLIADKERAIAEAYDMIHPNAEATQTVRSVFVIDGPKKVRLTLTYPASTGRDFDEILRAIDSLQLTSSHQVATPPANWRHGDDVIILASVSRRAGPRGLPGGLAGRAPVPPLRRRSVDAAKDAA